MENVLRYYGNNPELITVNKQIEKSGECPFCEEGIQSQGFEVVGETAKWVMVLSQFPYRGAALHLLLLPKRHIVSTAELTRKEWGEWPEILQMAFKQYPFLEKGFGLGMREKVLGGVTLYHLHFHLIAPKANEAGEAEIPVNFGIG